MVIIAGQLSLNSFFLGCAARVIKKPVVKDGFDVAICGEAAIDEKVDHMGTLLLPNIENFASKLAVSLQLDLHAQLHVVISENSLVVDLQSLKIDFIVDLNAVIQKNSQHLHRFYVITDIS